MKFQKLIILIIVYLSLSTVINAQIDLGLDKIKQIKLLESNRDDVRKIFAGYKSELGDSDTFETKDAEIRIHYSEGKCSDDEEIVDFYDDWKFDVDKWKVDALIIVPKESVKLLDLKFDISKFKKEKIYYNSSSYLIHNKSLGIFITNNEENKIENIIFRPIKSLYPKLCDKTNSKKLIKSKSAFLTSLKDRFYGCILYNYPANVYNIIFSFSEITKSCRKDSDCSNNIDIVSVFAAAKDDDGDVLTYNYQVTGGKIIGTGDKVLWDLSDVKPGTYSITASVDDGCGFCGESITKSVTVKE